MFKHISQKMSEVGPMIQCGLTKLCHTLANQMEFDMKSILKVLKIRSRLFRKEKSKRFAQLRPKTRRSQKNVPWLQMTIARRFTLNKNLDLPRGVEWMIRGPYTSSLRFQTAPFGRCWYKHTFFLPIDCTSSSWAQSFKDWHCQVQ